MWRHSSSSCTTTLQTSSSTTFHMCDHHVLPLIRLNSHMNISFTCFFFLQTDSHRIFEYSLVLLQTYAKSHSGKNYFLEPKIYLFYVNYTRHVWSSSESLSSRASDEEEKYNDLLTLLNMLSNLLSRDLLADFDSLFSEFAISLIPFHNFTALHYSLQTALVRMRRTLSMLCSAAFPWSCQSWTPNFSM